MVVVVLVLTLLAMAVALLGGLMVVGVGECGWGWLRAGMPEPAAAARPTGSWAAVMGWKDGTAWRDQVGGERAGRRSWLDRIEAPGAPR